MAITFSSSDIESLERFYRVNLIHSLAGYKSPFLIGSMGEYPNLAIFSSVFHLGSDPPLLGIKFRPINDNKHTYRNLKAKGSITINTIDKEIYPQGHLTSARLEDGHSEFEFSGLGLEYRDFSIVPFVKQSNIKILADYKEEHRIQSNNTIIVVVEIKWIEILKVEIDQNGVVPLDQLDLMVVNGLYNYYLPSKVDTLKYVSKPKQ